MNLQQYFPEKVGLTQAAELLGITPKKVAQLVEWNQIESSSTEELPLANLAKYLMETKGWDQEYTEIFIHTTLNPCASI